jgi:exonuclease III
MDLYNFKIITLNVRGLRQPSKRKTIITWLDKKCSKDAIIFLQETHNVQSDIRVWEKEWTGLTFFSHGTKSSRGVITHIGSKLDIQIKDKIIDDGGRYIILSCLFHYKEFLIVNTYFPNTEKEQVEFLKMRPWSQWLS